MGQGAVIPRGQQKRWANRRGETQIGECADGGRIACSCATRDRVEWRGSVASDTAEILRLILSMS
ncbi:protein of unknown function [Methylocaldum szegediense]|uniref:Transposase n=1 Tax=Methylocaldum szegediense TaxID=73780 RepID=A0ABM9I1Y3_9GAMM|nr:protein of unknown function [Methylocaldum szegediense]